MVELEYALSLILTFGYKKSAIQYILDYTGFENYINCFKSFFSLLFSILFFFFFFFINSFFTFTNMIPKILISLLALTSAAYALDSKEAEVVRKYDLSNAKPCAVTPDNTFICYNHIGDNLFELQLLDDLSGFAEDGSAQQKKLPVASSVSTNEVFINFIKDTYGADAAAEAGKRILVGGPIGGL